MNFNFEVSRIDCLSEPSQYDQYVSICFFFFLADKYKFTCCLIYLLSLPRLMSHSQVHSLTHSLTLFRSLTRSFSQIYFRCPVYVYLPPQCHYKQSPTDRCCRVAECDTVVKPTTKAPVTPSPQTTAPIQITVPTSSKKSFLFFLEMMAFEMP